MTRVRVLPLLDATGYQPHALHAEGRQWVEKNCYVDVCIELLHALGLEPRAVMGSCAAVDFEGDNFTFFKPSHDEVRALYGVDFQEFNVWRPLLDHAVEQVAAGKFLSTEADAYYLPDVDGTDYRRNHVKTTIIVADVDAEHRRLGYFHNAGYFTLKGDDFDGVFRTGVAPGTALPLYAELVRVDRLVRRAPADLGQLALAMLATHHARRPVINPVARFRERIERDLPAMQDRGIDYYHAWAFATVRQAGAAFELLALHLEWLDEVSEVDGLAVAAERFFRVSALSKAFILKAARAVNRRRPLEAAEILEEMASAWLGGMDVLDRSLAGASAGVLA
jgi:hypothetical protein